MQIVFHSPKDTLAGVVALMAVLAIIVNAVFLQAGRHPSPLFGTVLPAAKSSPPPVIRKTDAVPVAPVQQAAASCKLQQVRCRARALRKRKFARATRWAISCA